MTSQSLCQLRRPQRRSRLAHWIHFVVSSYFLWKKSASLRVGVTSNHDGARSDRSNHAGRHICLFDNYEAVRGPYFSALLDQLMGETQRQTKNLAYFTSRYDVSLIGETSDTEGENRLPQDLSVSLDLDDANLFLLDDWNPLTLGEQLTKINPTIVWVQGSNAFHTRHLLRTSGLDRWLQEHCAPPQNDINASTTDCATVFVGEGAGALCAGSRMAVAYVRGDDPKMSPELQIYGLDLIGDDDNECLVSFGVEPKVLEEHSRTMDLAGSIQICCNDQIFVWSQSPRQTTATTFIMTPRRRGMIERYSSPDPWLDRRNRPRPGQSDGGVACCGEPAIDPSRSMQHAGDSEWMEEF
jgi:hypothetical protein